MAVVVAMPLLIYVPPVQQWLVSQAASIASEATGLDISVGSVSLRFPMTLALHDVEVMRKSQSTAPDTIAIIGTFEADVALIPLFRGKAEVKGLAVNGMRLNTFDLISDTQLSGTMGRLAIDGTTADLQRGTVDVASLLLADADICVCLSDTAAVDTTESEPTAWYVALQTGTLRNVKCQVRMPGDSLVFGASIKEAVVSQTDIDLLNERYAVGTLTVEEGTLGMDNPFEPRLLEGMDYAHIAVTDLALTIDSIVYASTPAGQTSTSLGYGNTSTGHANRAALPSSSVPPFLSFNVRQASLKEQCGLQVDNLNGRIALDSLGIRLPSLSITTPFSNVYASASVDYEALNASGANASLTLEASLGRHDIVLFAPVKELPDWPLSVKAKADGNISNANIEYLTIDLPTALHAEAQGTLGMDSPSTATVPGASALGTALQFTSDLDVKLQTQNVDFVLATLDMDKREWRIPSGLTLEGNLKSDGQQYTADIIARDGNGTLTAKGLFNDKAGSYALDADISHLSLARFMPDIDCTITRAQASVKGRGFDIFDKETWIEAQACIDAMTYDKWNADSLDIGATLSNAHAFATITSRNSLADGTIDLDFDLAQQELSKNVTSLNSKPSTLNSTLQASLDFSLLNLQALGVTTHRLDLGLKGDVKLTTDFKDSHKLSGLLKEISITDTIKTHHPENLGVLLAVTPDTTYVRVQNGNFIVKLDASGHYSKLIDKLTALSDTIGKQLENRVLDQAQIKQMLPEMRIYVTSGQENAPANILRAVQDIRFKELLADITMSPEAGVNGQMYVHKMNIGETLVDTIHVTLKDSEHGLTYQSRLANSKNNPMAITAMMDGHFYEHGVKLGLRIFDQKGRLGVRLGTQASMESEGMRFKLLPARPTLAYKEFSLNDDNFIFIRKDKKLGAKVQMKDDEGTTIDVYSTEDADSTRLQDFTVSISRLDLRQLTKVLPFMPRIDGLLDGDFHMVMDQQRQISVAADIKADDLAYEGSQMGDLNTEFVYLQTDDNSHVIDGFLTREGQQIAYMSGSYVNKKSAAIPGASPQGIDATLTLQRTPLNMVNGFIADKIAGLEGFAEGDLTMKGPLDALIVDGQVKLDSATLFSTPYGVTMAIDDTPIKIERSKLTLDNFKLYAAKEKRESDVLSTTFNFVNKAIGVASQPADTATYITISGYADFGPSAPASVDFRLSADELLLINSKQTQGSLLYGKGFVGMTTRVRGPLDNVTVRGRLQVLGKTDITYLLLDSPLSTDNQMDELVKFTDFSDSTQIVVQRPMPSGIDLNMTLNIDPGAHVRCGLNADQSNYVDIFGGGNLRMRMSRTEEMQITGRYTLNSGTMKYSLPVIPLKTFNIQDGSYVEFTGDPTNPTLNITAVERKKAPVSRDGSTGRSVTFECGVVVTKTLKNMGVQFILSAPDDMNVQSELQAMTVEQRGKLAVTMLTTGMYLADGNTSGFSMNAALSSFLQSEINSIAGNALSTLDLSVGVDNATDANGTQHTDYSFQFAKRFWNNRLKVQIGGKVSSGQEAQGQKQSFFDNVSMEYRLSPTRNEYLKLFYNQNVYDWLDGYTGEYGGGFVWKKKVDHWWDPFLFWKKKKENNTR